MAIKTYIFLEKKFSGWVLDTQIDGSVNVSQASQLRNKMTIFNSIFSPADLSESFTLRCSLLPDSDPSGETGRCRVSSLQKLPWRGGVCVDSSRDWWQDQGSLS